MIQDNEHLLDCLNGALQVLHRHVNLRGKLGPRLIDIVDFVNVQSARIWSKLLPNFLIDLHTRTALEVFHCASESVRIGCGRTIV